MSCLSNVVIVNDITETASVSRLENLDGIHLQRWHAYATPQSIRLNTVVIPNKLSLKMIWFFPLTLLKQRFVKHSVCFTLVLVLYKHLLRCRGRTQNRGGKVDALLIFFLFWGEGILSPIQKSIYKHLLASQQRSYRLLLNSSNKVLCKR